ncbi:hypothetical protein HDU67_006011, partial [Dinochytrium kinnereticum]
MPGERVPPPPKVLLDPREDFWSRINAAERAAIAYHNQVRFGEDRRKRRRGGGWEGEEGGEREGEGEEGEGVFGICFTVQALTTLPFPVDLESSISTMMNRGGYIPSILISQLWIHLLRTLPLPKFESLFPHMFNTSVTRPMIRRAILGSLIRGECTGRRREEAMRGGRELAELVRTTCNNEDEWRVVEARDGVEVFVRIFSTDVPGSGGREVCYEALAVKKLLYSLFIRGLDADFQREGGWNGNR